MSKIVQIYSDKERKIKAYPKTLADSVYMDDGVTSVKEHVRNKINFLEDASSNVDVPEVIEVLKDINGKYDATTGDIQNLTSQLETKAKQVELEVERQRINGFTTLSQGSTTGDAELIDGRVGVDGTTYSNIGGAIRGQSNLMNNKIDEIANNLEIQKNYIGKEDFIANKYWNYLNGTFVQSNTTGMYICKIEKLQIGTYYISKCKGFFTWLEKISSKEVTRLASTDIYFQGRIVITEPTNLYITITQANYDINDFYFTNFIPLSIPTSKGVLSLRLKNKITKYETDFLETCKNLIDPTLIQNGKYFNGTGGTGSNVGYCCISIPIEKGRSYSSSEVHTNFTFFKSYATGTVTLILSTSTQLSNLSNYVPSEEGYLLLTASASQINKFMLVDDKVLPDKYVPFNVVYSPKLYGITLPTEYKHYDNIENVHYRVNIITVAKDGTGDFTHIVDAYNSIADNNKTNRHKIIIKQGTYDFGEKYNSVTATGSVGIVLTKKYVYFEGENPNNTILYFDGCPSEVTQITNEQAFRVSLFHFGQGAFKGSIKNLTLRAKNCRYTLHPETAGQGNGGKWLVENCIFDFLGNPNVASWGGASVGIGISCGEKGVFRRCKWTNYNGNVEGLVGHNNPFDYVDKPPVLPNCQLTFENCDFGNTVIHIDNIYNITGFYDVFTLNYCTNIARGYFGHQNGQTENVWRCVKKATKITLDEFDY